MPQRMDAAGLGDACALARPGGIAAAGKQPVIAFGAGSAGAPVQAQLVQKLWREKAVGSPIQLKELSDPY